MAEAVRDLLEAFYNVLYDTMFEAVALFMGEWGRGGWRKGSGERRAHERERRAGNKLWCLRKHRPGRSLMGALFLPRPASIPCPCSPTTRKALISHFCNIIDLQRWGVGGRHRHQGDFKIRLGMTGPLYSR